MTKQELVNAGLYEKKDIQIKKKTKKKKSTKKEKHLTHNQHARKTEGTILRQALRRKFNKKKK